MNNFGQNFRISIFGESHGEALGIVLDGITPGISLCEADFSTDIDRRKPGAKGTTTRKEEDAPMILSGVFNGYTTGAPLAIIFKNNNTISSDYKNLFEQPRPSHADFVARNKYNSFNDYRGGGHFSGRITLALVAAGVVAKKITAQKGISTNANILSIGGEKEPLKIEQIINDSINSCDSVGGIIECISTGLPIGIGEPFFNSIESIIAHLAFSVPAIKGIEFGAGFDVATRRGSSNNDAILDKYGKTNTNNDGGAVGGVTNGNDLIFRVAVKPTPSISKAQESYCFTSNKVEELIVKGRHDSCIALRVPVIIEAITAIAIADLL